MFPARPAIVHVNDTASLALETASSLIAADPDVDTPIRTPARLTPSKTTTRSKPHADTAWSFIAVPRYGIALPGDGLSLQTSFVHSIGIAADFHL